MYWFTILLKNFILGPFRATFGISIKIEHIYGSPVWIVMKFVPIVVFLSQGLPKYIKIKVLITCFYLM